MTKRELRKIVQIQNLIGMANGNYQNDRNPSRFESVVNPLNEAFKICLELTAKYPPICMEK